MAKLPNLWLKGGSQRLGGVVLYQSNGQTLARELAAQVSNPRTDSQMQQRVKLANVVAVYRSNKNWMRGAFENKKQGESDYNAFVKANLGSSLVATSKSQANAGAAVVAPYKITEGSIPTVECVLSETIIRTNLYLGNYAVTTSSTVQELTQALMANNGGIQEGMQLSVILNLQQATQESGIPYIITRAYECILSLTDSRLLSTFFPGSFMASGGSPNAVLELDMSDYGTGAAAVILSQTIGGKTRVSTQYLTPFGDNVYYSEYTSSQAWAEAIISYGENTTNFLDSNTAQAGSSAEIQNYITGLNYNSALYRNGGTISGGIESVGNLNLYLNDRIPADAAVTLVVEEKLTQTVLPTTTPVVADNRQRVTFQLQSSYSVEVLTPLLITLTAGNQVMQFNINVDSGDIS